MHFQFVKYLTVFFLKAKVIRLSALILALTVTFTTLAFAVQQSLQPSKAGTLRAQFGDYEQEITIATPLVLSKLLQADSALDTQLAGKTQKHATAFNFYHVYSDNNDTRVNIVAADWSDSGVPGDYEIVSGRLPVTAGEAVITENLLEHLKNNEVAYGQGFIKAKVVGVVKNLHSKLSMDILVTKEEIVKNTTNLSYEILPIYKIVTVGGQPEQLRQLIKVAFKEHDVLRDAEELSLKVTNRADITNRPIYSETILMLLIAPFAAGIVGGAFTSRFILRVKSTLLQIGINGVKFPALLASLLIALCAVVLGILSGLSLALLMRPFLATLVTGRLGEIHSFHILIGFAILSALLGVLCGNALLLKNDRLFNFKDYLPNIYQIAPVFSALSIFAAVYLSNSRDLNFKILTPLATGMIVISLAVYLIYFVSKIRPQNILMLLGLKRLTTRIGHTATAVGAIAAAIMLGFSTFTISYAGVKNFNDSVIADSPPDEVRLVLTNELAAHRQEINEKIVEYAGLEKSHLLYFVNITDAAKGNGVYAAESATAIEDVLAVNFNAEQLAALEQGAVVALADNLPQTLEFVIDENQQLVELPLITFPVPEVNYRSRDNWFMIVAGAKKHNLTLTEAAIVYPQLNSTQFEKIAAAPKALGFNPGYLFLPSPKIHKTETPQLLALGIAAGALASVFVISYAVVTTRTMRPVLATFRTLGLPRKSLRKMLSAEVASIAGLGLALGIIAGIAASYSATVLLKGPFYVPWLTLATMITVILIAFIIATLLSAHKISVLEREI